MEGVEEAFDQQIVAKNDELKRVNKKMAEQRKMNFDQKDTVLPLAIDKQKLADEIKKGAAKEWYLLRNDQTVHYDETRRALGFLQKWERDWPYFALLIEVSLVTSVSNAQAERFFTDH